MASNLFSLKYQEGIKRDNTPFQATYCTDGQWIRFQNGYIKKIGGMKGGRATVSATAPTVPSNLDLVNVNGVNVVTLGAQNGLYSYSFVNDWVLDLPNCFYFPYPAAVADNTNIQVKSVVVERISNGTKVPTLLYMVTHNLNNINDITPPIFFSKPLNTLRTDNNYTINPITPNPLNQQRANAGMCFASSFLFLYGGNGLIEWSSPLDTFNFVGSENSVASSLTIATDKVIYAAPIRGGTDSPSLLFWSLSSVVRVTNAGVLRGVQNFRSDVISSSSSIMSSRSVVEYGGVFFWMGTDGFFVFNGVVNPIPNSLNLNYVFDNIDLAHRERVFGQKNSRYNEIWWFYCDKRDYPNPIPGNYTYPPTRAVIYNKITGAWFDTRISREAGCFPNSIGNMITVGRALAPGGLGDVSSYVWLHEQGNDQSWIQGGISVLTPIESSFTTPTISWAAFPPGSGDVSKPTQLLDRWIILKRLEPDFVCDPVVNTEIGITVYSKQYAQSTTRVYDTFGPIRISGGAVPVLTTDHLTFAINGRNLSFKFSSVGKFEVGNIHFLFQVSDGQ